MRKRMSSDMNPTPASSRTKAGVKTGSMLAGTGPTTGPSAPGIQSPSVVEASGRKQKEETGQWQIEIHWKFIGAANGQPWHPHGAAE